MFAKDNSRPLVSLMTEVVSELAYLMQTEIRLARAELSEKASAATNAGVFLGFAAALSLSGFIILLIISRAGSRRPASLTHGDF